MNLEGIMPSERSQTEKGRYCMVSLMWTLKNITKQMQTYRDREKTSDYQRWGKGQYRSEGEGDTNFWV